MGTMSPRDARKVGQNEMGCQNLSGYRPKSLPDCFWNCPSAVLRVILASEPGPPELGIDG